MDWQQHWTCEDCWAIGVDVGVPEACPQCGSVNTAPISAKEYVELEEQRGHAR